MTEFVPGFIIASTKANDLHGDFCAHTLFVDISGFTALTRELMTHGMEGAEVLSNIINDTFSPAIDAIYRNGGFVSSFAGDAFTAIFKDVAAEYALSAAFAVLDVFKQHPAVVTKYGTYKLAAKIGLSSGPVEYGILDAGVQTTYYFKGEAIDNCAAAEHQAATMQIVADSGFLAHLSQQVPRQHMVESWYALQPAPLTLPEMVLPEQRGYPDMDKQFMPKAIRDFKGKGEFRQVSTCFINFQETGNLQPAIKQVMRQCHAYGGYFNRVDFGDKGPVMLVLFGAPIGKEKQYQRAAEFVLSLRSIAGLHFRAGITTGIAFAGFIGSDRRREYTALGEAVNLAARLMTTAPWDEVRVGEKLARKLSARYILQSEADHRFKGFGKKVRLFTLLKKIPHAGALAYQGAFIGRQKEMEHLQELIRPIYDNRFAGFVYIDGPAGIGKSRFMQAFISRVKKATFFLLPCDGILRQAFNPFSHFFKRYFEQEETNTKEQNKDRFQAKYRALIDRTPDREIKEELLRTESVVGALVGLEWQDSLYSQLDPKGRHENTMFAVKNLIKACSLHTPLVLAVEDAHWIDADSRELLDVLMRNIDTYPICVIAVCRPRDDGSPVLLHQTKRISTHRLALSAFDRQKMSRLLRDMLHAEKIPCETEGFVWKKSNGNPFFVEQLVMYLSENALLDGEHRLTQQAHSIPASLNQIIIARIDRLSASLKECVKAASVLGREFALQVLRKMLLAKSIIDDTGNFEDNLQAGYRQQIWQKLTELSCIFKHALIRDAAYGIQLKSRLRALHDLAGSIIEDLHADAITEHYQTLAEHFHKAENREKAVLYLDQAAKQAQKLYQNETALMNYNRLLTYFDSSRDFEKIAGIMNNQCGVLERAGKWQAALENARKTLSLAKRTNNIQLVVRCMNTLANILRRAGNIKDSESILIESIHHANQINDKSGLTIALLHMGNVLYLKGEYSRAMARYKESRRIAKENGDQNSVLTAVGNMGTVFQNQGNSEKAIACYKQALTIADTLNLKHLAASYFGNLGNIHEQHGGLTQSMTCFNRQLEICKTIGDKHGLGIAYGNIGNIHKDQGRYAKAMDFYHKSLSMKEETGNTLGVALTLGNMGNVYRQKGNITAAMELYQQQLAIFEDMGHKKGMNIAFSNIGTIYAEQGEFDRAIQSFTKQLAICGEIGNKVWTVSALGNIGVIYKYRGDYRQAMTHYTKALALSEALGNKLETAVISGNMGMIHQLLGDFAKALSCYDRTIEIARAMEYRYHLCYYLFCKADLFFEIGKVKKARSTNDEALHIADAVGRQDIQFKAKILQFKLDNDPNRLAGMLENTNLVQEQKATIHYEVWKMTGNRENRHEAIILYQQLLQKTPKQDYKDRLNALEESANP